jgi:phage gpG-like protein
MILNATLVGDRELITRLGGMPKAVQQALLRKVTILSLKLENRVKTQKLNGQVLNRITGRLARSIAHKVVATEHSVYGSVFSSGDVKYAAIHEYGGTTAPHLILPKKAKALAFLNSGGEQVFAAKVNHPGSKIPERSFLRSSLKDMSSEISLEMKRTVVAAVTSGVQR